MSNSSLIVFGIMSSRYFSRLINHSCDPSASAKIISINGQSKIVIYAKRTLHPGEEVSSAGLSSPLSLRVPRRQHANSYQDPIRLQVPPRIRP